MVKEALLEGRPEVVEVDFPTLISQAKTGNEEAIETICNRLNPRLNRYFLSRLQGEPEEAKDLAQKTLIKIILGLPNFDPTDGSGNYDQNFYSWFFTIAKNTWISRFRQSNSRSRQLKDGVLNDQVQSTQPHSVDLMHRLEEKLDELLPEQQSRVVRLKLQGKKNREIATELDTTEGVVKVWMTHARKTIEEVLIFPTGFRRVCSFDKICSRASKRGTLEAVQFLGRWYTTEEMVKRYASRRQIIDQKLLAQGYLLLSQQVSPAEFSCLIHKCRDLLTIRQNRFYISPVNLNKFRKGYKERKRPQRIVYPGPGYLRLVVFSKTVAEYGKLRGAIQHSRLKAVKVGRWWFTSREEVDNYLSSQTTATI